MKLPSLLTAFATFSSCWGVGIAEEVEHITATLDERRLVPDEEACWRAHNLTREAHGLPPLTWLDFFMELADSRAIELMFSDLPYIYHNISRQYLREGELVFSTANRNVTVNKRRTLRNLSHTFAQLMQDIVNDWYLAGVFNLDNASATYTSLLDPSIDSLGCALRYLTYNDTMLNVYVAVAYRKMVPEGAVNTTDSEKQHLKPNPGLTCSSKCENASKSEQSSCLSHMIKQQNATESSDPGSIQQTVDCECVEWRPVCRNSCYVRCYSAASGRQSACHGESFCTCTAKTDERDDEGAFCF